MSEEVSQAAGDSKPLKQKAFSRARKQGGARGTGAPGTEQELARMLERQSEELRRMRVELAGYEDLYQRAPVGYLTVDEEGCILRENREAARLCGERAGALRGKRMETLVAQPDRGRVWRMLREAAQAGQREAGEFCLERPGGEACWVHADICGREIGEAGTAGIRVALTDISQRKQMESRWRESENLRHCTFEALREHIAVLDQDGRIVAVNQAWLDLAERNEAGGLPVSVGEDYLEVCRAAGRRGDRLAKEAQEGISAVLAGERKGYSQEYPCRSAREERWFLMNVVPLGEGTRSGAVISHIDITERRVAEEAVRTSEERMRVATQAAGMFSWEVDVERRTVRWSENAAAVIGCRPQELSGDMEGSMFFVAEEERERMRSEFQRVVESRGITAALEFRGRGEPGSARHYLVHARVLYGDDGLPLRLLGVCQDISERKRSEEQLCRVAAELRRANEDLKKFNRAMVGRERRMVELKREVNELCSRLGEERRYLANLEDAKS